MLLAMRSVLMLLVLGVSLVACGSDPLPRPFVAQPTQKSSRPPEKAFAGKVTFTGLSSQQLFQIRLIPESGSSLAMPGIQTYSQVDGFWFQGEPDEWFKIPDRSEVWVGRAPEKYDGTAHRGGLEIYYRSSFLTEVAGVIRRSKKHPAWVRDEGQTKSPVASPFIADSQ